MSAAEAKKSDDKAPSDKSTAVMLFTIAADTTWRMFVPIVGATVLGVLGDRSYGSKPWLTTAGIIIGVIVAGLLVGQQLKGSQKDVK